MANAATFAGGSLAAAPASAESARRAERSQRRRTVGAVARGGTFVLAATLMWHASNFAFNAVGARSLGASGYGQLAAVVALLYVVSPVLYALQASASSMAARLLSAGRGGEIRGQMARQAWRAAGWSAVVVCVAGLGAGLIAHLLRLSSPLPVLLLLASMPLAAVVNVQRGALQGIGRFGRYSASTAAEAGSKIALACALLLLWPNVNGAVLAAAAALGCAALLHPRLLRALPPAVPTGRALTGTAGDGALTLGCLVLLAVMLSGDVIAARHGMTAHGAGVYAAVSLAGKVVFFATSGLTWVLFPMLSARDQRGEDGRKLLLGVLGGVALVAVVVAGIEWLAPAVVIVPLTGHGFESAAPWLGPAACAFAPYALTYVLGMGLAARRCRAAAAILAAATAGQVAAFMLVPASIAHLLLINAAVFTAAAGGLAVLCLRRKTP
jgi:O-antigen/teichoic acid export membrane protein